MSDQQEVHPPARRRVQKFGLALCLLLVVVGIGFNVAQMFDFPSYRESAAPLYISTLVLCLAAIVGLLALMAEE